KSTGANLCQIAGECLPSTVVVLPDLLERRHEFTDHCCTGRFSLFGRFRTVDVAGPAVVTSSSRTVSATANDHLFHGNGRNVPGAWCCGAFACQPTHRHVFGDLTGSTSRPVCHGTWWGRYSHGIIGLFRTRRETKPGPTMVTRLRDRALKSHGSVATLALFAILVEAATMWPYLVGISLIAANGPDGAKGLIWLAFYNVIMILPGTILTWARARYPQHTELLLTKTRETMTTAGSNFTAWLAIVIGAWLIIARLF